MATFIDLVMTGALFYIAVNYGWIPLLVCLGFMIGTTFRVLMKEREKE